MSDRANLLANEGGDSPPEYHHPSKPSAPPPYAQDVGAGQGPVASAGPNTFQQQHAVTAPIQQQQQHATVVVNTAPRQVTMLPHFGENSVQVCCPNCRNDVRTSLEYTPGTLTWIVMLVIFLFFWPLFCIPLCIDELKDVNHNCPICNHTIGTYKRM